MSDDIVLWTVYAQPSDYPDDWIARKWLVGLGGPPLATDDAVAGDLENIRRFMEDMGLACLPRDPSDDPTIVETWI